VFFSPTIRTVTTATANWFQKTLLDDVNPAKIVITHFHAFKLREHYLTENGDEYSQKPRDFTQSVRML
jgi:hypothetical protein